MVNTNKRRDCEQCDKAAAFGIRGVGLTRCFDHKEPGMTAHDGMMCRECDKHGSYAVPGSTERYCGTHKDDTMVSIKKCCVCDLCGKGAVFGNPGDKKATRCATHAEGTMTDITSKRCAEPGCEKHPCFGPAGGSSTHCGPHGALLGYKNVKGAQCDHSDHVDKDSTTAWYGFLGARANRCAGHRDKGMVQWPTMQCSTALCRNLGVHHDPDNKRTRFCDTHKPKDAIGMALRECNNCKLPDVLDENAMCVDCREGGDKRVKRKELAVKALLDAENLQYTFYDKAVYGGECIRTRPDFFFETVTHVVLLECDENQHSSVAYDCERTRMFNISQAIGTPVSWIRFNPDAFKTKAGRAGRASIAERNKTLVQWVKAALARSPAEDGNYSNVVYLFFDGYDSADVKFEAMEQMNQEC